MNIKSIVAAVACTLPLAGQAVELTTLADWMTGSFNSKAQSVTNKAYYDINLEMVQIWPNQKGAVWLYVEQAVSANMDKPYRQRVYKLEKQGENQFISTVYALPEPKSVIGAYKKPESLNALKPTDLVLREGCHINIASSENSEKLNFSGSTDKKRCSSKLRGASYATSKVTISDVVLTSWDQGFDSQDLQVWGAEQGPYVFDKIENYPVSK